MPTFSVNLVVPNQVYISDTKFPVKISAQYTFGKPVKGQAVISFSRYYWRPYLIWPIFTKTISITTTSVTFDVDIGRDLGITSDEILSVSVVFTEALTGKTSSSSGSISFSQFAYEIVFTGPNTFTPNANYNYQLSLRKNDGKPVRKKII